MKPTPLHPEAAAHLVWFNGPGSLDNWTLPLLEAVTLASALLALAHALRALRRRGDSVPLAVWLAALVYGVVLEVKVYNTVDNFWHGEFMVMLYYNQLPLYVMARYPAVLYYTWGLAGGCGLTGSSPWRDCLRPALASAFSGQVLYAGFDNLGPQLHWWTWDTAHPTLQPFWSSVPSTSYLWMWTLCFSFPLVARLLLAHQPTGGPLLWCLLLGGLYAWDLPTFLGLGEGRAPAGNLLLGVGSLVLAWVLYVHLPMRARQVAAGQALRDPPSAT